MKRVAVSLFLTRDAESSEAFLVKRNPELKFFGAYWAFPGGVVDEEDRQVEVRHVPQLEEQGLNQELPAFLAAAARELFEETGLWLARGNTSPSPQQLRRDRKLLLEGEVSFEALLAASGCHLEGADFEPICRITTPAFSPVRYDTWFFRCQIPAQAEIEIWPGELTDGAFFEAAQALQSWQRGEILIVPPVLILLEELKGRNSQSFLRHVRDLTASYARGKLHRVYFSPGVLLAPLATITRPPASHTNAYLVGEQRMYLVDPGSADPAEQQNLWELLDELLQENRQLEGILLTHSHSDHVGAVLECSRRYGMPVFAHAEAASQLAGIEFAGHLEDGQELDLGNAPDGTQGWKLRCHLLPGHAPGHLAFQESRYGAILAGDLISTVSSILIDPSQGDLATYMKSLQKLHDLSQGFVYPGHGPPARRGRRAVAKSIQHRQQREAKLVAALESRPQPLGALLERVYDDVSAALLPLARRSLLSGLIYLEHKGQVEKTWRGYRKPAK